MTFLIVFFILHWYISLFCQSFFMHRYGAHSMFTMNKKWEKFFFIFSWITQGSSYLSPYAYAILHRMHHAYTDTKDDPHSPSHEKGLIPLMLKTWKIYKNIYSDKIEIPDKFKKNLPVWKSFDRFASADIVRIVWVAVYISIYIIFAPSFWWFFLIPVHCFMSPIHGAIINYFAHKYGYRNFKMEDTSKNFLPVDILMLGESYHNNHHKYISRPNFGVRWFEFDPTYPVIKIMSWLRVIRLNKA